MRDRASLPRETDRLPLADLPDNALLVYDACMYLTLGEKTGPVDVEAVSDRCGLRVKAVVRHLEALKAAGVAYWWRPRAKRDKDNTVKLDMRAARAIRREHAEARGALGVQSRLARQYGVSVQTISDIVRGVTYREPEPEPAAGPEPDVDPAILAIVRPSAEVVEEISD